MNSDRYKVFDGTMPWSNLNDAAVTLKVIVEKKHPPYPRFLSGSTEHAELWWEVMTKCWAHELLHRPTLLDIVASFHIAENMPTTELKWDRPVPTRLRDPLIQISSGLPCFLNPEGLAIV